MSHNVGMNPTEQPSPSPLHSQVDDHDKNNTTPIPRDEHAKVVEAKAAVVLLKHSRIFTNNEYVQWRLKILFQPLHDKTYESMQFLYLSKNRKPIWKPDAHLDTANTSPPSHHHHHHQHHHHHHAEQSQNASSSSSSTSSSNEVYVLSPRTNLMTLTYEYRLVYIVDLSSSLATVGSTTPTILLSGAFESLRNSLEGVIQPFALQVSASEKVILRPILRLTVMADCSQFASNINVIPMLAEHPTMRVFMQNVLISHNNIDDVISELYSQFVAFQRDTMRFRSLLKRKRSNFGYDLDVSTSQDVTILDTTSLSGLQSPRPDTPESNPPSTPRDFHRPTEMPRREEGYHSSKREVWGLGKSGANLSRILHAGHFALKLLPPEGNPQLILITDGAMKSNVHDNTFVRQFADENVTCHVIQVGSAQSFVPGRNFGFVPDNEILLFLTRATNGSFIYSHQCTPATKYPIYQDDQELASLFDDHTESTDQHSVIQRVPASDTTIPPPNEYHSRLLFHESCLAPRSNDTRLQSHDTADTTRDNEAPYNFPWDPYAKPPQEALRLLRYREYPLPTEFSHIIASRAREGFSLHSVSFDDNSGMKRSDVVMQSFDAPDISSIKKERVQIVMTLQWQPNIVVEYRIRATWLPAIIGPMKAEQRFVPSTIFCRAKAPRAEIFVRTEAEFAHMLQNWDVFRRRAQMMGVVTGAAYVGDAYTAPSYAKAERLKNYLNDIFEGDETLKSAISFNTKYLSAINGSSQSIDPIQQRHAFVENFHDFWERLNETEGRSRTRSWYDHDNIDLLIGDVSPYMAPKLASMYNQDFVYHVEAEISDELERVRHVLRTTSDFEGTDGTFVRVLNRFNYDNDRQQPQEDGFSLSLVYPPSFYEIRIRREYGRLVSLRFLFFNMDVQARRKSVNHMLHLLQRSEEEAGTSVNTICQRPFSRLLMRDEQHFETMPVEKGMSLGNSRAWYLPVALWLTSEYIVRDYLRHMTWSWQTDSHQNQYHKEHKMMPIHDLAFQFLCQARLDQGYQLVTPRPDSIHFYQEIKLPGSDQNEPPCAIQYFIWKDSDTGKITTELWMEPSVTREQYELVKIWTVEPDRKTISQLVTFDQIHALGRSKSKEDFRSQDVIMAQDATIMMMLPQLFDVVSVLETNAFVVASYPSPRFQVNATSTCDSSDGDSGYDQLSDAFENVSMAHTICLRPDNTLNAAKEKLADLDMCAQSYALLNYFVEGGLKKVSDGEIAMESHKRRSDFWRELSKAMSRSMGHNHASGIRLTSDLCDTRCFVKIFDPRSFVIILFPTMDSIIKSLSDNSNQEDENATATSYHHVDIVVFECVRQKPIKPSSKSTQAVALQNISSFQEDDEDSGVTINKIDWLVHEEDGLGITMRPQLYEGHFKRRATTAPQLSERALRITQDIKRIYCRSFFRSFFTCLLRGFTVNKDDLGMVLDLCDESTMEIDITDFINVMTLQRRENELSGDHEDEIQRQFKAVLQQYFAPIHTTDGKTLNLFYYRPSFPKPVDTEMGKDEKIALLVDLVAYSQIPLLVRLECVYTRARGKKTDVATIPITSLPMSFTGKSQQGKQFNFEPATQEEASWSPLVSGDVTVSLHIVCLNMPRSLDEDYATTDATLPLQRESLIHSMRSRPTHFSSLTRDQQEGLAETEARIRWLLTEETLHGLLRVNVVTKSILRYVATQLGHGSIFVKFPTVVNVPFQFVKDPEEGRKLFMDELEKQGKTPGNYQLQRVGDYFYVSLDAIYNMSDEELLATTPIMPSPLDETSVISSSSSSVEHDDLCHGLGISTLDSTDDTDHEEFVTNDSDKVPFQKRPLYWLVLHPQEDHIRIFFYSKLQIHLDVIQRVTNKLLEVQDTTNRLILLRSLQETRMCSKFLEPIPENGNVSSDDEDEDDDNEIDNATFTPGQFGCPIVYTKRFPLHWRLQPNVAIKYLTADVLRLFVVMNRPQMFVIERESSIVYCKIFEQEVGTWIETEGEPPTIVASSPLPTKSPMSTPVEGMTPSMTATRSTTGSTIGGESARELVLQVHGIDLPSWIEQEFVDLLENRLISHITLNEIQQVFLRNPNTKPTPADVRFILPLEKPPKSKEVFDVPILVNDPSTLMSFFKQAILMDSIKSLAGPYVTDIVGLYNRERFAIPEDRVLKNGECCFYYNCTQRVPGSSTPLELAAGQGMAGICITAIPILQDTERVSRAPTMDVNPERIKNCLEKEFRESSGSDIRSSCKVWIEIWTTGSTDADPLMQYLYECFRQSLCDYFIEKTVTVDFGAALLQRALLSPETKSVSKVIRKRFIDSILYILQKAAQWKSSTVFSFEQSVRVMPWAMDDILDYINCELCNIDTNLRMTVAGTLVDRPDSWELYQGQKRLQDGLRNNIRLVGISGLSDFVEKLGNVASDGHEMRRTSVASDRSTGQRSRRSSTSSHHSSRKASSSKNDTQERSRSSSRSMSGVTSRSSRHGLRADGSKHCFLILLLDAHSICVYTYNWSEKQSTSIFENIFRAVNRQATRNCVLDNILHQKIGLFHHAEPIKKILDDYSTVATCPSLQHLLEGHHYLTPHIHMLSPKHHPKPKSMATTTPTSSEASNLKTTSPESNMTPISSSRPSQQRQGSTFDELTDVISYATVSDKGSDIWRVSDQENDTTTAAAAAAANKAIIQPEASDIDRTLAGLTAYERDKHDHDVLKRHGLSFLNALAYRANQRILQEKTRQVCVKWSRHYYDAQGQQHDYSSGERDKLTRGDIQAILRSARVFHYCRTPLLFSRYDEKWENLDDDMVARDLTVDWYRKMLTTLVMDYASYLEGVQMRKVDVSTDVDAGGEDDIQYFCATQNLLIDCQPLYLLRVVRGGSIMGEIRLTGNHVSVTLYTLHGQYGRLADTTKMRTHENVRQLEETCGRFKQLIHINSFVYDFHLRYIQQLLSAANNTSDNLQQPAGTFHLNLLLVLRQFCAVHKRPASYARNRVIHGFYQVTDTINRNKFFDTLLQSAPRHGMRPVMVRNKSVGAAVTSHDLSFISDGGRAGLWKHTLIICPAETTDDGLWLEYFILVVYQGESNPEMLVKNGSVTPKPNAIIVDPIDAMLLLDGYTMDDIVTNARDRMDTIVAEVIMYCKRHNDWSELYEASSITLPGAESARLTKLLSEFDHIDVRQVDQNMIFSSVPLDWHRVFDLLTVLLQRKSVKDIRDSSGKRHLLLYNHGRYMDFMIHLQLDSSATHIQGWMVSRESNRASPVDGAMREQIANLGNTLCHILWMETVDPDRSFTPVSM